MCEICSSALKWPVRVFYSLMSLIRLHPKGKDLNLIDQPMVASALLTVRFLDESGDMTPQE